MLRARRHDARDDREEMIEAEMDRLYEQYGTPLEAQHAGSFLAIAPDGRTLVRPTLHEVVHESLSTFGPGSFVYKIGPRAVGRVRWTGA